MFATIRRYDGVDQNRIVELTTKANETLVPKLSTLDGFKGYYMIEAGDGVISSLDQRREAWSSLPEPAEDHDRQGSLASERRHRLIRTFSRAPSTGALFSRTTRGPRKRGPRLSVG